jgi:hypothetical protein
VDALVLLGLALAAVGGFVCIRARRYAHAITLCGVLIPLCFVAMAIMFGAAEAQIAAGVTAPPAEFLIFGYGALATALVAGVWAIATGVGVLWRRRAARWEGGRTGVSAGNSGA